MRTASSGIAILCCAAAAAGALAGPASASSLPKGKYQCYQFSPSVGYLYWGSLAIKNASRYVVNGGPKGKYRRTGRKVKWLSGPLKGWTGKLENRRKIAILDLENNIKINCNR